jgi:polyisoprenoid-binding protein YceI
MRYLLAFLLATGLLIPASVADPAPAADSVAYGFDNESSTMTIYGSSNVRDWTMDVSVLDGTVVLNETDAALPGIQKIDVTVPVEKVVSDKDKLQKHAHEALEKDDHPTITFTSSDVQVATAKADSFSVSATGDLTIAGETQSVTLTAKGVRTDDGMLAVAGEHRLKLSGYDVERPSLFFGALKVTDPVRLAFDVRLAPSSSTAPTQ